MNSSLLLLLAALFTVSGPLAAWATPCTRPMDCQLNGDCVSGKCECDKGWAGDDCGQLNLDGGKVAYGHGSPLTPNTSSWGGGPPQWDEQQQQYHLFVSEIQFGCGMGAWAYFSAAAHAVSPNIDGPYTRVDLAVPVWTHNTLYAYSPQDKMHLIFSIGEGDSNSSCNPPIQCAGGITPGASHLRPPSPWPANVTCPIRHTTTVHSSRSLDGPWESASLRFSGSPAHDPDPLNASFGGLFPSRPFATIVALSLVCCFHVSLFCKQESTFQFLLYGTVRTLCASPFFTFLFRHVQSRPVDSSQWDCTSRDKRQGCFPSWGARRPGSAISSLPQPVDVACGFLEQHLRASCLGWR